MAADLHVHVKTDDVSEEDLASFFSNTLGSKYFSPLTIGQGGSFEEKYGEGSPHKRVSDTPNVWIGEVSWLKQAVFEVEEGHYVPDIVQAVNEIVGEDLPVIDDELIGKFQQAFADAKAHEFYDTVQEAKVIEFLDSHRGKPVFTVSW